MSETFRIFSGRIPEIFRTWRDYKQKYQSYIRNEWRHLRCQSAFLRLRGCICRLRVHKVSKQVNLIKQPSTLERIRALLCCICISVSWNFLPQISGKFFAELFLKSTVIFPEFSGNFCTHNPRDISLIQAKLLLTIPNFCCRGNKGRSGKIWMTL